MVRLTSRLQTERADAFLFKLCKHFARKVRVEFDERRGVVAFAAGLCRMHSDGGTLAFACEAADVDAARAVARIVDGHVALLLRADGPAALDWRDDADG